MDMSFAVTAQDAAVQSRIVDAAGGNFLEISFNEYREHQLKQHCEWDEDQKARATLDSTELTHDDRRGIIEHWLRYNYRTLMGYTAQQSAAMTDAIMAFYDASDHSVPTNVEQIIFAFHELESRLKPIAPKTKTGKERDVTSLTSKALWLFYPQTVPIFDGNARRAVEVLRRLLRIGSPEDAEPYVAFLKVWFEIYERLSLDGLDLPCSRVRAVDRWLWYLGEDSFR
jgi:hypothetical protein